MKRARWVGAVASALWAGSWYLMYLEITRWHHVRPTLAFNSDPDADGLRPRPGMPLKMLYVMCAAAPLTVLFVAVTALRRRGRKGG